jgi:hypothetical protein
MINFETITHEHCLFFLGAVAGEEGPLLNILKANDNKYYFTYYIFDDGHYKDEKAILIVKETTIEEIEAIFSEENLSKNDGQGLGLLDIFEPSTGQAYYETLTGAQKFSELKNQNLEPVPYKTVKERVECTLDNYELLGVLNWSYDKVKRENLLTHVLEQLDAN